MTRCLWTAVGLTGLCLGCSSGGPFDYVPVEGTITYEDGSPISNRGLELRFYALDAPQIESASPRPAISHVDPQGRFEVVTSYKYGDGLIPGRHKVVILNDAERDGKQLVPQEYTQTSETPLVVYTKDSPFDIKVPRP